MSTVYTGVPANVAPTIAPTITEPVDGDNRNAASVQTALQKLTDFVGQVYTVLTGAGQANVGNQAAKLAAGGGGTPVKGAANLVPQAAPSAPDNGDIWTTSAGIFARVNGVTLQLVEYANTRVARAWGQLICSTAGAVTVIEGFNVASASYATTSLTVNFTNALVNGNFAVVPAFVNAPGLGISTLSKATGSIAFNGFTTSTGALRNWANGDAVDFVIFDS